MLAHRLVKARNAAAPLDGEGARRAGGRWNPRGMAVAYCASSLSLAVLELLVHVDTNALPDDLVAIQVDIPDDLPARRVLATDLPGDWRQDSGRAALRALGARWFRDRREPLLVVPSVVVPGERNVLINPLHPDAGRIEVVAREPFRLDPRLG
jgi:RES domain-containing protein